MALEETLQRVDADVAAGNADCGLWNGEEGGNLGELIIFLCR